MSENYLDITQVETAASLIGTEDLYVKNGDGFRRVALSALVDFLDYEPIKINSLSIAQSPVETGGTFGAVTVSWQCSKTPVSVTVTGESAHAATPAKNGSYTINSPTTGDLSLTVTVTDERGATVSKSVSVTFCDRIFWFAAATFDTAIPEIPAGAGSVLSTAKARTITVNAGAGEYIWYVVPSSIPAPSFSVGGFAGGFSRIAHEMSLTNQYGSTASYDVWRSDQTGLGQTTVAIT